MSEYCEIADTLIGKCVNCYKIELPGVNMVCAITGSGMAGCAAFDVDALAKFNIPAVNIKGRNGLIDDADDLLEGTVSKVNETAKKLGVRIGMSAKVALKII